MNSSGKHRTRKQIIWITSRLHLSNPNRTQEKESQDEKAVNLLGSVLLQKRSFSCTFQILFVFMEHIMDVLHTRLALHSLLQTVKMKLSFHPSFIFFSIKSLSSSILVGIWVKVSFLRQQVFGGGEYSQGFWVKRLKVRNACLTYRTEQNVEGKQRGKNKMSKN